MAVDEALTRKILEKAGDVISTINKATRVGQIISSLHSLAVLLFPIDSSLFSGSIDQPYRDEVTGANAPSENERIQWREAFYRGAAFPTIARVLLQDVASNWLACFPISARKHVYDVFFVDGLASEVVQTLVPHLQQKENNNNNNNTLDTHAVRLNAERLLVVCLLEDGGVLQMAREFSNTYKFPNHGLNPAISTVAQLVASIPDKAQSGAPTQLSSHLFFKQITIQLILGAEKMIKELHNETVIFDEKDMDGTFLFTRELFARICRRGSADVLLREIVPRILTHVQVFIASDSYLNDADAFKSQPVSIFWLYIMEAIKDQYAVERICEKLLHHLATENVNDVEAYWIIWTLLHGVYKQQTSIKSMFLEKFLLWKVFPLCCLRWILQFCIFECPPVTNSLNRCNSTSNHLETMQRLVAVWSKREFVQTATAEQQAYITAGVGLILENMSKQELDATKDVMQSILQGVTCRLESPNHLVRKMASGIALAFSKVIDPKNPLYLDDDNNSETVDWDFGMLTPAKSALILSHADKENEKLNTSTSSPLQIESSHMVKDKGNKYMKGRNKTVPDLKLIDPDEIIDPAILHNDSISDEDDGTSENSDTEDDASLQPYDLSDDDSDLKRNFSQLVDVVGALRKSDDADGVEGALDVAEKLVRASPDELRHVAADLARTLVQTRCSDLTIEGEEDSAEEKRQRALVALIVTSPLESLDTVNKLLYSPNVDTSQRILILDVMTDAAQELAFTRIMKPKYQVNMLISTISDTQPWYLPSSTGHTGAGLWKEVSGSGTPLNWAYTYERDLPCKVGQTKRGKTRRWSVRSANTQERHTELSQNKFPVYAAAFMLPSMLAFDKKRQGVDLLGRDFIVLGKLIYMLGICMKCAAMHPEASALAPALLDMLSSREVCLHAEAYVRRSVLFAASCVLVALHPSYIASALTEGNVEICKGLEWIRTYALSAADSDTDEECYTMAMTCLQLHAEMALQASRAMESVTIKNTISLPSRQLETIKLPYSNVKLLL